MLVKNSNVLKLEELRALVIERSLNATTATLRIQKIPRPVNRTELSLFRKDLALVLKHPKPRKSSNDNGSISTQLTKFKSNIVS